MHQYTIRMSTRAKNVCIQVSPHGKIEVVVPPGFDQRRVVDLMVAHRQWLDRHLARRGGQSTPQRPKQVFFRATGEAWQVRYQATSGAIEIKLHNGQALSVVDFVGACNQWAVLQPALLDWLKYIGKMRLPPVIRRLSAQLGLPINRVTVRNQKTRWGSCSSKHNINLNCKLLFLTPELVRYVMIHELCHTIHMNHSRAFWALVERYEPDYRRLDQTLDQTQALIPDWAFAR